MASLRVIGTLLVALALPGCLGERIAGPMSVEVDKADAVAVLQTVHTGGNTCWVRSGWRDFRPYRLVPELDTRAGKPRILVVRANDPRGLPQMVIEASGNPVQIAVYGPLSNTPLSARINDDVVMFAGGGTTCT